MLPQKDMLVREKPSTKELLESKIKDLEEEMESKLPKESDNPISK